MSSRLGLALALLLLASAAHADEGAPRGEARMCPCADTTDGEGAREGDGPRAPIDLNRAGEAALLALPGIGAARARAILAYRAEHGGFRSVSQLLHIRGIGRALLKQLRPLVTVGARDAIGAG